MDGGVVLFSLTNLLYNRVCNFSIAFFAFSIDKGGKEDYNTIKPTNHVGLQGIWFASE
jgi:hypothetical protein